MLCSRIATPGEREFHTELLDISKDLRDLHTNYLLPNPYRNRIVFLGILIERYEEDGQSRWIVSKVADHLVADKQLKAGALISHWNGMPIDLAVWRNANQEAGSKPAAPLARGQGCDGGHEAGSGSDNRPDCQSDTHCLRESPMG